MEKLILKTIKKIQSCNDLGDLKTTLVEVQKQLNFSYILYGIRLSHTLTNISHFIVSNYPDKWFDRYDQKGYIKIDPVVKHCAASQEPFCWDRFSEFKEPLIKAFVKDAANSGLVGGVSIGMHKHNGEVGIFSLAANHVVKINSDDYCSAVLCLTVLQPYVHEAISRLSFHYKKMTKKPKLTQREQECLIWAAEGKKSHEISIILSISEATVVFHLKNAIEKLDVINRSQAIAKAILLGIISPQYSSILPAPTYHF